MSVKTIKLVVKLAVLPFIIIIIYNYIDISQIITLSKNISIPLFMITVLMYVGDDSIMGMKWKLVLNSFAISTPIITPIKAYLKGRLFAFLMPSTLGIDAYKVYYIKGKRGVAASPVVHSILVERFLGMISSLTFISLTLFFSTEGLDLPHRPIIISAGLLFFVISWISLSFVLEHANKIPNFRINYWPKINKIANGFIEALREIKFKKNNILAYFGLSIAEKIFFGSGLFIAALSLGINEISYIKIISCAPILALLARLPISFSSLGIQESLLGGLFYFLTGDFTSGIAVGIVMRAAEAVFILFSGILWFTEKDNKALSKKEFLQTVPVENPSQDTVT